MKDLLIELGEEFMKIQWKSAIYHGKIIPRYRIGSNGSVKDIFRNRYVKTFEMSNGYICINLMHGDHNKKYATCICGVHRLVAEAFIPNPENKPQVNHIDGNKQNNCVENLEWVTRVENMQHAVKNNLLRPRYGSTSPFAKHLEKDIHEVCKLLELGIHTVREIHELTGVSIRTINGIFRSNKWHQITSHYDIKKPVMRKPHRVITDEMNDSIYKIIHDGFYNVAEILDHLGWEHSGPNKQIIRARLRRYRASTTTESRIEKSEE